MSNRSQRPNWCSNSPKTKPAAFKANEGMWQEGNAKKDAWRRTQGSTDSCNGRHTCTVKEQERQRNRHFLFCKCNIVMFAMLVMTLIYAYVLHWIQHKVGKATDFYAGKLRKATPRVRNRWYAAVRRERDEWIVILLCIRCLHVEESCLIWYCSWYLYFEYRVWIWERILTHEAFVVSVTLSRLTFDMLAGNCSQHMLMLMKTVAQLFRNKETTVILIINTTILILDICQLKNRLLFLQSTIYIYGIFYICKLIFYWFAGTQLIFELFIYFLSSNFVFK